MNLVDRACMLYWIDFVDKLFNDRRKIKILFKCGIKRKRINVRMDFRKRQFRYDFLRLFNL